MSNPPLKILHSEENLVQLKLEYFRKLSTQEIKDSLHPGQKGSLRVRPDGTVLEGNHRLIILREREENIDDLPREIEEKDFPGM